MQRHLRLRHKADFARLRTVGRAWYHPFFIVSAAPNGLPHNRYGLVTSKHVGNAVTRNRTRRLLREAIRGAHSNLQQGHDMAIIARKPIVGQSYAAINAALCVVLQKADLWMEHAS